MRKRIRRSIGPHFSEGARRLWIELETRGQSLEDVRREISVGLPKPKGKGMLNRWLYGDSEISVKNAARIEDVYGIPTRLWAANPVAKFNPLRPLQYEQRTGTDG